MFLKDFRFSRFGHVVTFLHLIIYVTSINVVDHPTGANSSNNFEDANYWRASALADLELKLKTYPIIGEAKNVIFFLGDGWDIQTLTAARILKGQKVDRTKYGEEAQLYLERFPFTGFSKTYCDDSQVADSACSATAYLGGVKANIGTLGVTADVKRGNCTAENIATNKVTSILSWAQAAGKCTGIVTTTSITDASPAGAYAHSADRNWQTDADLEASGVDPRKCDDIAKQLILSDPGRNIDVIMGGGRVKFMPKSEVDFEGARGERTDRMNLLKMWRTLKAGKNAVYVETAKDLERVDTYKTDALLGIFAPTDLAYFHDQPKHKDPRLKLMTQKAIEICSKNPKGYFLMVEGGRIDHGHHDNLAQRALWEVLEFDNAIQTADEMTDDKNTLIVVTADHGHVMTFSGYAARGTDIMGIAGIGKDNLPYATLNYDNGPAYVPLVNNTRYNISKDDLDSLDNTKKPMIPLDLETHGGQDVQILAKGPFAHLLSGIHEQNYIPIVMAYASCVGSGPTYCRDNEYYHNDTGVYEEAAK